MTGPEGRHIKAQCFSTGWVETKRKPRSRTPAKGWQMNPRVCPASSLLVLTVSLRNCTDNQILRALRGEINFPLATG